MLTSHLMFIDESGEANNANPDSSFDIFTLCGVIFQEDHYKEFDAAMKAIKVKYFGTDEIVFHSFCMRNKIKKFVILKDELLQNKFYADMGNLFTKHYYKVFSCTVKKGDYRNLYPSENDLYQKALQHICERCAYFYLKSHDRIKFCLETRGPDKDRLIKKHFNVLLKNGTIQLPAERFEVCHSEMEFKGKGENINGLQFADLCAYPIARKILSPEKTQPTLKLFTDKLHFFLGGDPDANWLKVLPETVNPQSPKILRVP